MADYLLTVTRNGYVKMTDEKEYSLQYRGGSGAIGAKISKKTGPVVAACRVDTQMDEVVLVSKMGKAVRFKIRRNLRPTARNTSGVRGMRLRKGDKVVDVVNLK